MARRHPGWLRFALPLALALWAAGAQGGATAAPAPSGGAAGAVAAADSATAHPDSAAAESLLATLPLVATPAPAETVGTLGESEAYAVFLGGQQIFQVRTGRGGLDPRERARAIRQRLTRAIADERVPVDSLRLLRSAEGIELRLGPHFLWLVTPADLEVASVEELVPLVGDLPERVREGIERERRERTPARLLLLGVTLLALLLLVPLFLRLLFWLGHRWRRWLRRAVAGRLRGVRVFGFNLVPRRQVVWLVTNTVGRLDAVIGVGVVYAVMAVEFSHFPWTQGWGWYLGRFARDLGAGALRAVLGAIPNLVVIVVILVVSRYARRLSDRFFDAVTAGEITLPALHAELGPPSRRLAGILLWVITLVIIYPYIPGSDSRAVQGATIVFGAMLSLGSTGVVGNVLAGLVLTYARAFRVGDRVRIGEHVGDVTDMGFFAAKLRTPQNEEVTLANGFVAGQTIVNYTRLAPDGLWLRTSVTIGYDAPWRTVHALLIEAAGRVRGVEAEPGPRVYQHALGDYSVRYDLHCVTHDSHDQMRLYSDLHAEIQDGFARAGVEILSPAYAALRDANQPVLPLEPEGPRAGPGGFRVRPQEKGGA